MGTTALEAKGLQRHSVGRRPLSTSRRHDDLATGNSEIIADSNFRLALAQGNLLGVLQGLVAEAGEDLQRCCFRPAVGLNPN